MITLSVHIDGEDLGFSVPTSCRDITFSSFLDFRKWEEGYFKANENETGAVGRPFIERALSFVISGPVEKLPFSLPGDDPADVLRKAFNFRRLSLLRLYGHVVTLIGSFDEKPEIDETYRVEYKGETYYLEPDAARRFVGAKSYQTGEVIEVDASDQAITEKIESDGDESGSLEFERELRAMAVLLRKDGEELPVGVRDRRIFLEDRMLHFRELPMAVVLAVRFFLHDTLIESAHALITSTSFGEGQP